MKQRTNILLILLLAILPAAAQVRVEVARKVNANTKFALTIVIDDINGQMASDVTIPNCELIYGGAQSTAISMSNINGKIERKETKKISYTFLAQKASDVTIPAYSVRLSDGKVVKTKPQPLTILPSGQSANGAGRTTPDIDDYDDGARVDPRTRFSEDDIQVRILFDKSTVYEQEPVVATIKLYSALDMNVKFQMLSQPTFENFLSEELDVPNPRATETINGKEYFSFIVKRCVLYPQKSGKLTLTSGTYEITLEQLVHVNTGLLIPDARIVTKTIKTPDKSVAINVLPLPQPRPAEFDGAVGIFSASTELSSTLLHTNDPATYTITIKGKGNIKYLKTPKLTLPEGMDQYTPKTEIDAQYVGGDIAGTYTATYTIVPQEVGTFEIPSGHFCYFDPQTKKYNTIELQGYKVRVEKGSTAAPEQKTVSKKMQDILHIHPISRQQVREVGYVYHAWWYWMIYAMLVVAFISAILVYRRQIRLNADVKGRRLAKAMRVAMKRFKTARKLMHEHDSDKFYTEINHALTGYLSDKLGIQASQLVRDNIASQLQAYGLDTAAISNVIGILDDCEMARFTPMHTDSDMESMYRKVLDALKSIENAKK